MTKTAWVFPGQGSQSVGMGSDLLDQAGVAEKLKQAENILGWSVPEICQGPEEQLSRTLYTQPCLFAISAILADLLQAQGQQPDLVAGHSLGEYNALYTAGVFDFATGLRLVKRRAELMDAAQSGTMAALIGFDRSKLEALVESTEGVVIANDNSDAQVVISGTPEAVTSLSEQLKAKRSVPLSVSGAFHSPLMAEAAQTFRQVLADVAFQDARLPVLSNVDPQPAQASAVLKERLGQQMTSPVRWREITLALPALEVSQLVEVGPGRVLTGLAKRTLPGVTLVNVGAAADVAVLA
ncbi:ACP S-malonyltransferase [Leptolyngbya sp. FACHB-261]|uniref:ACP S-malonyltransferase n=1 Tax=Leptolyngbya sp. FACHB-261 TaxID=2692806 RepID=UPI0016898DF6|nr:ACP S-malonyltransferase [Leptolyngbya sp. FACHB-261]MBD2099892.1 ACP S-malonyltransferase [Leptolyngbya sp. FACHB-261]